jgi:integrase
MKTLLKLVTDNTSPLPKKTPFIVEEHPVYGGKALVVRTKQSGNIYHLRMWISSEHKYYRESLRTPHLETAVARAEAKFNEISYKTSNGKKIFSPTLQEAIDAYLAHRQEDVDSGGIVQGRLNTMRTQLKHVAEYLSGTIRLSNLDSKSIYGYRKWRAEKGTQDVTIRNEQATINAMCRYAYDEGMFSIPKFVFPTIFTHGVSKDAIRRATYTDEEYKGLYEVLREYTAKKNTENAEERYTKQLIRHFILIASNSMMRFGELRQLKWGCVRTYDKKLNKNDVKKVRLAEITVKAHTSKVRKERICSVRGGEHLDRLKTLSVHTLNDDYVFTRSDGKLISKRTMYYHYGVLMDLCGIDDWKKRKLTYYSLRHYGITKRVQAGVNILKLATNCGTSPKHIQDTYYHASVRDMEETALIQYKGGDEEYLYE